MRLRKALEQVFFILGTFITCIVILAASDLQAQTLLKEQLGLRVAVEVTQLEPSLSMPVATVDELGTEKLATDEIFKPFEPKRELCSHEEPAQDSDKDEFDLLIPHGHVDYLIARIDPGLI